MSTRRPVLTVPDGPDTDREAFFEQEFTVTVRGFGRTRDARRAGTVLARALHVWGLDVSIVGPDGPVAPPQ